MRDSIINNLMNLLNNNYKYDSDTYDRVKYGLEVIYINITKIIVIFSVSLLFGVIKETLLFSLFVNGLRSFAYGIHAKKSSHCYIYSLVCFVLLPYIFSLLNFNFLLKLIISIFSLFSFILFAPADTHKRPIININQRKKLKILSIVVCMSYIAIIFIFNNKLVNNMLILSMIIESVIINPITYRLFKLPYNNYKEYLNSGV